MESGVAVSQVTNFSAHGDRIGEIRINLKTLGEVSFKWMVEIHLGNSFNGNRSNDVDNHQNHKVNFCLVNADGTYDTSHAVMQSKLNTYRWSGDVENQCKSHRFDYYLDLGRPAFPYAFLAIRHYTYKSSGYPILQPITVKLILTPLDESQTHVDSVRRKYPDINKVNVVVPGSMFGGQDLTRTSLIVSRHSLHIAFIDETPNSVVFNHHDSLWLELTTTNKISSLLFHVQDEYGQDLKKKTDPNKIIRLTVSFADVPKSIINS